MDDILKEAIADAKALRATALENAKIALEEAFTPRLKNMLSQKIQSEVEHEDEVEEDAYAENEVEDGHEEVSEEDAVEPELSDEDEEGEAEELDQEIGPAAAAVGGAVASKLKSSEDEDEAELSDEDDEAELSDEDEEGEDDVIEVNGIKYAPIVSEEDEVEPELSDEDEHGEAELSDEDEDELDLESVIKELEEELDTSAVGDAENKEPSDDASDSSEIGQGPESEGSNEESGNENSEDNKEMGFYAEQGFYDTAENKAIGVNENWRDITGVSWNISGDFFDVRIAYMEHQLDRDFVMDNDTIRVGLRTSQKFYGVGGSLDFNPFTVLFEYNYVRRYDTNQEEWPTFLLSLVYTWNEFQPYIVYSKADQYRVFGKDYEEHTLISYGIRYDFANSASLKVQFDNFNDQGHEPSGWDFHGSSDTLSFGIDFVF